MLEQMARLFSTVSQRGWQMKPNFSLAAFAIRRNQTARFSSYTVLKNKREQLKHTEVFHNDQKTEKTPELSLLAKRMMTQTEKENDVDIPWKQKESELSADRTRAVDLSHDSTDQMRQRLEALTSDLDATFSESVTDFDSPELSEDLSNFTQLSKRGYQDNAVESIFLPSDIQRNVKIKPSPLRGTEDPSIPPSNVPCVGCGALLQCRHNTFPGFIPSEYFKLLSDKEMKTSLCQRCHYIRHCDAFVEVTTHPDEFAQMITKIRPTRSVVIMVVDVMDIQGSIIPHLMDYIGHKHPLIIVGNKADLLAPDCPEYLKKVTEELLQACHKAHLRNIRKCTLVSAKTGFGIERLINILFSFYRQRVDVFIVGTANAGKSSLFNALLASDYCKASARDLIQRATVSVWPGTTLNLLKFPIMRPSFRTVARRQIRLSQEQAQKRQERKQQRERQKQQDENLTWELRESVRMTDVRTDAQTKSDEAGSAWGQEVVGYRGRFDGSVESVSFQREATPLEPDDYKQSYWVYDTPGVINPDQVMNLLTPDESPFLTPATMLVPQCLFLKPHETVFVSGLARLDYVQGDELLVLAVHCAPSLPIQVLPACDADRFYEEHIGTEKFGIPLGDKDRLMKLPALVGKEFTIEGHDHRNFAAADIQFSSIGWISVAPKSEHTVRVRAYTPGRKGMHMRSPAVMPDLSQFKGKRIARTSFYHTKPAGSALAKRYKGDVPEYY